MLYIFEVGGLRSVAALASCQHGRLLHRAPGAVGVRIARQLCVVDWCALHGDSMTRPKSCGSTVSQACVVCQVERFLGLEPVLAYALSLG